MCKKMENEDIETYCVMCCSDTEHTFSQEEDTYVCSECCAVASDGILERDEEIDGLREKKRQLLAFIQNAELDAEMKASKARDKGDDYQREYWTGRYEGARDILVQIKEMS